MQTGESVELRFTLPAGIEQVRAAHVRLRCIQEYRVSTGSGRSRSTTAYQDQLFLEERNLERDTIGAAPREIRTEIRIPEEAPASQLHTRTPVVWEVELELDVPGINARYDFLLPVYPLAPPPGRVA